MPKQPYTSSQTHPEPHTGSVVSKLNWLRAGVQGANDGIVSVSGLDPQQKKYWKKQKFLFMNSLAGTRKTYFSLHLA